MSIVRLKEREYSISRLQHLKAKHPEAEEILSFMEKVLRWQLDLYEKLESKGESNWRKGLKAFYSLLELCISYGSETLRETAQSLMALGKEEVEKLIAEFLKERWAPEEERFIFLSFLNPFFSVMAESTDADLKNWLKEKCPVCGIWAVCCAIPVGYTTGPSAQNVEMWRMITLNTSTRKGTGMFNCMFAKSATHT
jgi:FdhE protein